MEQLGDFLRSKRGNDKKASLIRNYILDKHGYEADVQEFKKKLIIRVSSSVKANNLQLDWNNLQGILGDDTDKEIHIKVELEG